MTPITRLRKRLQRECNMHPEVARLVVNVMLDELRAVLTEESRVTLLNIGVFARRMTSPKMGFDFVKGTKTVPIPRRLELKFYPCPEMVSAVALQTPATTGGDGHVGSADASAR